MSFSFGPKSLKLLQNADPNLVDVITLALSKSKYDITIVETLRTKELQNEYVRLGKSKTYNSRHLADPITGKSNAIDFAIYENGKVNYKDIYKYKHFVHCLFEAADELNILIRSGADFNQNSKFADFDRGDGLSDFPHVELPSTSNKTLAQIGVDRRTALRASATKPEFII